MSDIARAIAAYVSSRRPEEFAPAVRHETARALINFFACAIGASRHATVDAALAAVQPFAGPPQAPVFGRRERLDALNAALVNGTSSHVFDFDDTLLSCAVHPTGPVVAAQLALLGQRPQSGADFMLAFVLGVEVEAGIAEAIHAPHYAAGWHITGTVGVLGAAAACGRMLGLGPEKLAHALGIAATQARGLRAAFGSMCKPFHVGHAAQGGLLAALLAERGFTAGAEMLEGRRGFAEILGCGASLAEVPERLGQPFALLRNSYKPYACGVVLHPVIDGCLVLRESRISDPSQIARIALEVHPLVLELTGRKVPQTGLEAKFSVYHAAAVAFVRGAGNEEEFSDAAARDQATLALRARVSPEAVASLGKDEACVRVTVQDGSTSEHHVAHASGSIANPMSDAALVRKLGRLAAPALSSAAIDRLVALCRTLETVPAAAALNDAAAAAA
ncbi:MAG: MmgE/PrpD family protein [Rhodospirillales bacterium]|nr:MmgE/PrpD family protein [Rhodospirillales bacterium]